MTHRARARARPRRWTRDTSTPFRHAFPSAYLFRDVSFVHVQADGRGTPPPASPIPARTTPSRVTGTPASRACPPARNPRSRNRAPITGQPALLLFDTCDRNCRKIEDRCERDARGRFFLVTRGLAARSRSVVSSNTMRRYCIHYTRPRRSRRTFCANTRTPLDATRNQKEREVTSRSSPRSRPRGSPSPRPRRMPSSRQNPPRPRRAPRSR